MLHRSFCSTSPLPAPAPVSAGLLPTSVRDTLKSPDFFPFPTASTNSFVFRSFHTLLTIQRRMVILRNAVTKDPPLPLSRLTTYQLNSLECAVTKTYGGGMGFFPFWFIQSAPAKGSPSLPRVPKGMRTPRSAARLTFTPTCPDWSGRLRSGRPGRSC